MNVPIRVEPITREKIAEIKRQLPGLTAMICRIADADHRRGCGVLGERSKCLWTSDGRRITFELIPSGGFIAACSKDPDPHAPEPCHESS